MDRNRRTNLLIGPLLAILIAGCAQELPRRIYLDSAYTSGETEVIMQAVNHWNETCRQHLAKPRNCLEIVGLVTDRFEPADMNDGRHVLYKLETAEEGGGPDSGLDCGTSGYGTLADIMMRTYLYLEYRNCPQGMDYWPWADRPSPHPDRWDDAVPGCKGATPNGYRRWLRYLTIHELGHFLGMMHYHHRPGVMNKWDGQNEQNLTEADIDQFCLVYDCR